VWRPSSERLGSKTLPPPTSISSSLAMRPTSLETLMNQLTSTF
jgi:hypothetical protein